MKNAGYAEKAVVYLLTQGIIKYDFTPVYYGKYHKLLISNYYKNMFNYLYFYTISNVTNFHSIVSKCAKRYKIFSNFFKFPLSYLKIFPTFFLNFL